MQHTKCHTDVESVELPLFFSVEPQTTAAIMVCLKGHVWNIVTVFHIIHLCIVFYNLIYVSHVLFGLHMLILSDIK